MYQLLHIGKHACSTDRAFDGGWALRPGQQVSQRCYGCRARLGGEGCMVAGESAAVGKAGIGWVPGRNLCGKREGTTEGCFGESATQRGPAGLCASPRGFLLEAQVLILFDADADTLPCECTTARLHLGWRPLNKVHAFVCLVRASLLPCPLFTQIPELTCLNCQMQFLRSAEKHAS